MENIKRLTKDKLIELVLKQQELNCNNEISHLQKAFHSIEMSDKRIKLAYELLSIWKTTEYTPNTCIINEENQMIANNVIRDELLKIQKQQHLEKQLILNIK